MKIFVSVHRSSWHNVFENNVIINNGVIMSSAIEIEKSAENQSLPHLAEEENLHREKSKIKPQKSK